MKYSSTAHVHTGAVVAETARLGDFVIAYPGAHVEDQCAILGFTQIWSGVRLSQDASLGPGVVLEAPGADGASSILIGTNAQIGAGAVICQGVVIGEGAVVRPGSVVAQNVPPYAIVSGSPIRISGYVSSHTYSLAQEPELLTPVFSQGQGRIRIGVGDATMHRFKLVRDMRRDLTVAETPQDIPFTPKRCFLVFNVPSEKTRGEHAHYKCHQFLVCVNGSCAIVADDGEKRTEVALNSPDIGIYLPPLTWGIQYKYSADATLLVFASNYYDPQDYIRNYADFVRVVRGK